MKLSNDDNNLLNELCKRNAISLEKVIKLLGVIQQYELMERRTGVYDELKAILKNDISGGHL